MSKFWAMLLFNIIFSIFQLQIIIQKKKILKLKQYLVLFTNFITFMKNITRKLYQICSTLISDSSLRKYKLVQKGARWARYRVKSDFVEIEGHKMFLDSFDSLKLSINKSYEEFETDIIKKIVNDGDVVLDIGANIGYYTLIFAKLVGKSGKVYAFEPEPSNLAILKKNIEINDYKNVKVIDKVVSNKNGIVRLYIAKQNKGGHSICDKTNQYIDVPSIKLDNNNFLNEKIDFIKIDVEGAEMLVLDGMTKLLEKNNNVKIIMEYNPLMCKNLDISAVNYITKLNELNFDVYDLKEKTKTIKKINSADDLQYKPEFFTNLLCIKKGTKVTM